MSDDDGLDVGGRNRGFEPRNHTEQGGQDLERPHSVDGCRDALSERMEWREPNWRSGWTCRSRELKRCKIERLSGD